MAYDIHHLKKSLEVETGYAFEIIIALGTPSLKLLTNSNRYEIYIELNKNNKTINPYLSFVIHDQLKNEIKRNNEIFNIGKILRHLNNSINSLKLNCIPVKDEYIQLNF